MSTQNITQESNQVNILRRKNLELKKALCKLGSLHQLNDSMLKLSIQKAIDHLANEQPMKAYETLVQTMKSINGN